MNSMSLKKSAVAFIVLLAMGSVGFNSAYGYGGGGGGGSRADKVEICHNGNTIKVSARSSRAHLSHGDVKGACAVAPQVLGASTSKGPNNHQQYSPLLTSVGTILMSVQSGNKAGDISDEDAAKFTTQLSQILALLMKMFQ